MLRILSLNSRMAEEHPSRYGLRSSPLKSLPPTPPRIRPAIPKVALSSLIFTLFTIKQTLASEKILPQFSFMYVVVICVTCEKDCIETFSEVHKPAMAN